MANFTWPVNVSISGPMQFTKDGAATSVSENTTTPSASTPLPVKVLDSAGVPVGFATAAKQDEQTTNLAVISLWAPDIGNNTSSSATSLNNIDNKIDFLASETTLAALNTKVPANLTVTATRLLVDGSGVTQPVSAASLPLPTGASTETTLAALNTKVPANLTVTATRLLVDGSGVTQPVSAASLPLPTGAATEATLSSLNSKVVAVDTGAVVVSSSALPTGAATEATLAAQSAKLPATLGGKTGGASLATVAASDTVSGTATAVNTNVIESTDVSAYQTVNVQLTGAWSGQVRAQFSNDNVTFYDAITIDPLAASGGAGINLTSNVLRSFQVQGRYFRLRATSYSSGTIGGTAFLSANSSPGTVQTSSFVTFSSAQSVRINDSSGIGLSSNYGVATNALRTAAQVGNAAGAADFGTGTIGAQTLRVGLASDQITALTAAPTASLGRSKVSIVRNDYSSVNVTTGAYVQLIASTSAVINKVQIFDSSGSTMVLAVGAAASEVDQIYIFPGGIEAELAIPAGSRVSIKAVSATASVGEISINFYS